MSLVIGHAQKCGGWRGIRHPLHLLTFHVPRAIEKEIGGQSRYMVSTFYVIFKRV